MYIGDSIVHVFR